MQNNELIFQKINKFKNKRIYNLLYSNKINKNNNKKNKFSKRIISDFVDKNHILVIQHQLYIIKINILNLNKKFQIMEGCEEDQIK